MYTHKIALRGALSVLASRVYLLILTSCIALFSCQSNGADITKEQSSEGADSMAVACYRMQVEGRFDDYVTAMKSCDSMPADYKRRMVMMLRHHRQLVMKERKGVRSVSVLRTEMHNGDRMANVFLKVVFNDGSSEEVLFPMVYDGLRWRVQ